MAPTYMGRRPLTHLLLAAVVWAAVAVTASAQTPLQQLFTTSGTWTAPTGVTSVSVACVGGGAGAGTWNNPNNNGNAAGGGGGALAWANNIPVTPGTSYTVTVGRGGVGPRQSGTDSWFISTTTLLAGGGRGATVQTDLFGTSQIGGVGGSWSVSTQYTSRGGGAGGTGGTQSWDNLLSKDYAGGGGGAGGWSGAGGLGGFYNYQPATAGAGGSGGGGVFSTSQAGGGGGTGVVGLGANGAAGGGAGSGGIVGSAVNGTGGNYGGGAGGRILLTATAPHVNITGAPGACRIMWGANRAYPSTNTSDVFSAAPVSPPPPPPATTPAPPPPPGTTPAPPPPPSTGTTPLQALFTTSGTWVAPAGVTSVSVACVGGGAGAGTWTTLGGKGDAAGGGGGGFAWANSIPVTPGTSYTVTVGRGGVGPRQSGTDSWFISTTTLLAGGGRGSTSVTDAFGTSQIGGLGGTFTVSTQYPSRGGGNGGKGGDQSWQQLTTTSGDDWAGGGGGAGGWNSAGGVGGFYDSNRATAGSGGGGGGGNNSTSQAGGGGGTGVVGLGANGAAGGGAGSGGTAGSALNGTGGNYGGGAGGRILLTNPATLPTIAGGSGACRIMWGAGRAYPSTNTSDLFSGAPAPVSSPPPPPPQVSSPPPPPPLPSTTIQVSHRILILTLFNSTAVVDFLDKVFTGYGIPFDVITFNPQAPVEPSAFLYNGNGSGKYSGIVVYPAIDTAGQNLGPARVAQLERYQRETGARIVRFGDAPEVYGIPLAAPCTNAETTLTFTADAPLGVSGIRTSAVVSTAGLYRCGGVRAPPSQRNCILYSVSGSFPAVPCNVTPVMTFGPIQAELAGAIVNYNDTREVLFFTFNCAAFNPGCLMVTHFMTSWITRNIIPGQRRVLLSTQVDDLFLDTEIYGRTYSYRSTPADYTAHVSWMAGLKSPSALPAGSNFKVEMAYNGNGIPLATGDAGALTEPGLDFACHTDGEYTRLGCNCWAKDTYQSCSSTIPFCKNCTRNWLRPLDPYGTSVIPANYSSANWNTTAAWLARDALANTVFNRASFNEYFWCSHTFTHQNLQNVTGSDALKQWNLNKNVANRLGLTQARGMAQRGVVTPAITGLNNVNNLRAMKTAGYVSATGDNTWAYLRNDAAPYTSLKTTVTGFGESGITIIPRWATEIYFNVNDTASELDEYNFLYTSFYGRDSTMTEILDREAFRVLRDGALALRDDPHMFHQANMGTNGGAIKSLLQLWVEAVTNRLKELTAWPVESLGMDGLLDAFNDRDTRNACALNYTLTLDRVSKTVTSIQVASGSGATGCSAPLLTTTGATLSGTTSPGPATSSGARSYRITVPATLPVTGLAW